MGSRESQIDFAQGVIYACARLIEGHGEPSLAESILEESGVDLSLGLEYDLFFIRRIEKYKNLPRGMD